MNWYLTENYLLYNKHFGFQKGHSTDHTVVKLADQIHEMFNKNIYTLGLSFLSMQVKLGLALTNLMIYGKELGLGGPRKNLKGEFIWNLIYNFILSCSICIASTLPNAQQYQLNKSP